MEDYKDEKYWKLGLFYYNKQDKRLFPPKKNEAFGWTINFANPYSILAFLAMIVFFLMIIYFISKNK